jgi:hypothetical protein
MIGVKMRKDKCEDCINNGTEWCFPESGFGNTCNYSPKPLDTCCLTLRGEDAKRFMEHLDEPPTENDKKIAIRVQEAVKMLEKEELIKLIGKMNCSNCIYQCSSSKIETCKDWYEK